VGAVGRGLLVWRGEGRNAVDAPGSVGWEERKKKRMCGTFAAKTCM